MGGPIPPSVGPGVKGHPHTPTAFLPRPMGGPDTSVGWSWSQEAPIFPHKVSPGALGLPQYLFDLFLGSRGTPIAASPRCQTAYIYTRPSHNARLSLTGPHLSPLAFYHRLVAPLHTPCGNPSCGDSMRSLTYGAVPRSPWPTPAVPAWRHVLIYSTPLSNPRMNARHCRSRVTCIDPSAMRIHYRGSGLITLVGMTHDTSLL